MGSIIIIRELVRNEDSRVLPQASCIRICILARFPGDLYTLVSLRSPEVDQCIPDRQPASTLSLNTLSVRAYYPTMHHILSSTTQFLLESSCKCSLTLLQSFLPPSSSKSSSISTTPGSEWFSCTRPHLIPDPQTKFTSPRYIYPGSFRP